MTKAATVNGGIHINGAASQIPALDAADRILADIPKRGKYRCIVVDPPWNQGKTGRRSVRPAQGVALDYPTMRLEEIKRLPIPQLASGDSFLWLWATNSKDRHSKRPVLSMAFELLEHWGFTFHTMITWDKKTGPCPFSPYQVISEHVLFAWRGSAKFERAHLGKMRTIIRGSAKGHSVKPMEFYEQIRAAFPGPRLDIFARAKRLGFDGWGDEYQD